MDGKLSRQFNKFGESISGVRASSSGYNNEKNTTDEMENVKVKLEYIQHSVDIKEDHSFLEYQQDSNESSNMTTKPSVTVDNNIPTEENVTISNNDNCNVNDVLVKLDLAKKIQYLENKVDRLEKKIDNLNDTLATVNNNSKKTKLMMQRLISVLSINKNNALPAVVENNYEEEFRSLRTRFPIGTSEELYDIENQLMDEDFKIVVVEYLSRFCGKSGIKTGNKVCYIVFDEMFERTFATACNWTGNTHDKERKKIGFHSFPNVVKTFHAVVCLANTQISYNDAVEFLKKLFRNSGNRAKAEGSHKRKRLHDDEND